MVSHSRGGWSTPSTEHQGPVLETEPLGIYCPALNKIDKSSQAPAEA